MVRKIRRYVTRVRLARFCAAGTCAALLGGFAGAALARDGDEPRGYLSIRGFDTNPATGVRDYWGASLGGNYNRYVGGELSLDAFERRIKVDGFGSVGEYGITALVPQIRLRYPLFDDRLTPYFVAGAGIAFGEFNDRKAGTFGKSVDADRTVPVGTVGAGIEYFLADTVAVGVEIMRPIWAPCSSRSGSASTSPTSSLRGGRPHTRAAGPFNRLSGGSIRSSRSTRP